MDAGHGRDATAAEESHQAIPPHLAGHDPVGGGRAPRRFVNQLKRLGEISLREGVVPRKGGEEFSIPFLLLSFCRPFAKVMPQLHQAPHVFVPLSVVSYINTILHDPYVFKYNTYFACCGRTELAFLGMAVSTVGEGRKSRIFQGLGKLVILKKSKPLTFLSDGLTTRFGRVQTSRSFYR